MLEPHAILNDRYRVDQPLGEGGMAIVYQGYDTLLGRPVAIKVPRPRFASDDRFRARFEREAQAAAALSHPHIVEIYDIGEAGGLPYIVMALVPGQTMKEIIRAEGPFHPDDVAELLVQVASALDYAHERGYVHRDVKPQNILVDTRGQAFVADFGIAKSVFDSSLTEVGAGLGSVEYLSPEQANGLMATPASDVYSLAVVAFEMLTGRLPFTADSPVAVALRHVRETPPRPSAFVPSVPAAVDTILGRALSKDPTRRFPSAGALATAMRDWREMEEGDAAGERADDRVAMPVGRMAQAGQFRSLPLATGTKGSAAAPAAASFRDEVGCLTWVVGTAILLGLIGLLWLGFQISPGFERLGAIVDSPTNEPIQTPRAVEAPPSVAPTIAPEVPTSPPAEPEVAAVGVPDLTGMTVEQATDAANRRGFLLEQADPVASSALPVNTVAAQEPRPGQGLEQGNAIAVRLSLGDGGVDLRALELIGRAPEEAERVLEERGLDVRWEERASREVETGLVAGVAPGERASAGETVTLYLGMGDLVRIPAAIQGQPLGQVERQLERAGLTIGERTGVGRAAIEEAGIDLPNAGIRNGDVAGVRGPGVTFEAWVEPGTRVDLLYYDRALDR